MSGCQFTWNPQVWPYVTRCTLDPGHAEVLHRDRLGREMAEPTGNDLPRLQAAEAVVQVLTDDKTGATLRRDKIRTVTMAWPALAASLAGLMVAHGQEAPMSFRLALREVNGE